MNRPASALLITIAVSLLAGCFVRPYVPPDAKLLARQGPHSLWRAPEGFVVVSTFQVADSRNEVCVFTAQQDAEKFYSAKLAGEDIWIPGCVCGPRGRVHPGDTYHDPEVSNDRCEKALAEGRS